MTQIPLRSLALLLMTLALAACGSDAGRSTSGQPNTVASCDVDDPATAAECGTVLVGLTDADGDFLSYSVDVVSLTLETANGRTVEVLPRSTRINFTDYVDLSELVTAATVPPATYVAGTIRLDYSDAEIFVEAGDIAKETIVTDSAGTPLTRTDLKIVLSERDRLVVAKGRAALLQVDFDLEASHTVDTNPQPATAAAEPFILAEVQPVDEKELRVRGPLVEVKEDAMNYVVHVRPFYDRAGDFGRVAVNVNEETEFEVDGELHAGIAGLSALAATGPGTPTIALGTLTVAERRFVASLVLAGSSIPGAGADAVVGNVIKREGNFLTVRGATLIPASDRPHFHDDVVVEIGPDTKVHRDGYRGTDLTIDAISVAQRVTIRGSKAAATTDAAAPQILFDATKGAVRMHVTHLAGVVNTVMPGQTDLTLHAIDRRRASVFDFSGTGMAPDFDADPDNYEVATGDLTLAHLAEGKPIVAYGFPTPFGLAPPDFRGRTIVDYTDVRSVLGVGWSADGTLEPFLSINADGIVLNNQNVDIDQRHYIKQGPVLIDLTALPTGTSIIPRETDRKLFTIATEDSLRQYVGFADFVNDLSLGLDGSTRARAMYARGRYDADKNAFTAYKIGVYLLEP